ncbi:MAG: ABC transporter ATP-binding protein, partial [Mangrovimonas sp.]|nr:ABC transporter ATP-binding protein [Mangrovimonas sp.]
MSVFKERLKEVSSFFNNNDVILGYRKFMDCAMDTQDLTIYREVIQLTDWKEKHPEKEQELIEKATSILEKISQIPVLEYNASTPIVTGNGIVKSYGKNRFTLG